MNSEYAKCLAWAFDYISHRIDRTVEFPNGDRYGAANIIMGIVQTLEGRIIQPKYKRVILSRKAASDCLKRAREAAIVPSVRPRFQNKKDRLLENARALDAVIAESNQWYADRGIKDPMQSMLLNNLIWRRYCIANRHFSAVRSLCPEVTEADLQLICAAANAFDAAAAAASEDFPSVIGLMTGAALLVSGVDIKELLESSKIENAELNLNLEYRKDVSRSNGKLGGRVANINHADVIASANKLIESGKPGNEINAVLATRFGCTTANIRKIRSKKTQPTQG